MKWTYLQSGGITTAHGRGVVWPSFDLFKLCCVPPVYNGNLLFTKCNTCSFQAFKVVSIVIITVCSLSAESLYSALVLFASLPIPITVVPTCCCGCPSQKDFWRWSGTPRRRFPGSSWPDWCLRERRRKSDYLKPRLSDSLLRQKPSELSPLLTSLEVWNIARWAMPTLVYIIV